MGHSPLVLTIFESDPLSADDLPRVAEFDVFQPFIKGVFSQWHPTPFDLEGRNFVTAEQWMMFAKATLFRDEAVANAICAADDPSTQKRLGQQVAPFEQGLWDRWKIEIVYRGNLAKFTQNEGAARRLALTAPAMLVEVNPRDWVWGVGLGLDNPDASTRQPGGAPTSSGASSPVCVRS
jgi:ribA/ribD-fused uncharacterized protein